MVCKLYINHLQVNAMENKGQQKNIILKTILTDFVLKENAITRYTRIYIKLIAGITQNKQRAFFSLWSLNNNSKNVAVVSRRKK